MFGEGEERKRELCPLLDARVFSAESRGRGSERGLRPLSF